MTENAVAQSTTLVTATPQPPTAVAPPATLPVAEETDSTLATEEVTPEAKRRGRPPKRQQRFFRSLLGFTDGAMFFGTDEIFMGSDTIIEHFERTGGYDRDRCIYVESNYDAYNEQEVRRLAEVQGTFDQQDPGFETPLTPQVSPNMVSQ